MAYKMSTRLLTRLIAAGGVNRFGEPMFRVVWGPERLTWIGGEWVDTDDSTNVTRRIIEERQVPKYYPVERYYLEKWMPPEHYGSPEAWAESQIETVDGIRIPNLGPYPSRGEYELSMRFQTRDGGFASIDGQDEAIVDLVRMIKKGEAISRTENWLAIQRDKEKKERDWSSRADDILDDTNKFAGKPHIYMPKTVERTHLTPRELKAIRYMDMGARVEKAPQEKTA